MADGFVNRAVVVNLDPSPAQVRMLRNYPGAARFGFNGALGIVTDNVEVRAGEREAGVTEDALTPVVSWSAYSLRKQFNAHKGEAAPLAGEVTKHCFDTGIGQAAVALTNRSDAKHGQRRGPLGSRGCGRVVAGLRPETQNAYSRLCETVQGNRAATAAWQQNHTTTAPTRWQRLS